jgi:hypothetical protein
VVTVAAASAGITFDSHEVAGTIMRGTIQDIPLNGRSSLQLASLEPGVTISAGASSQFNAQFNVNILGAGGGATAGSGVGPRITRLARGHGRRGGVRRLELPQLPRQSGGAPGESLYLSAPVDRLRAGASRIARNGFSRVGPRNAVV